MSQQNKKAKPANQKSKLLGDVEHRCLFQLIGNRCVSLSTAVVQLLLAEPPHYQKWMKKLSGVATFVKDNQKRSYYIRIYDLKSSGCIWEQEIYNQFKYNSVRGYFHTFNTDDCSAGLNFANEEEARTFCAAIQDKLNHRRERRNERKQQRPNSNRLSTPANVGVRNSVPARSPIPSSGSVSSLSSVSASDTSMKKKDKDKKKKKLTKTDIGAPSDFRHVGHVGWDPDKGFDMDNLDPNLKRLFDDAGVSAQELQDEDTAQFIYDFIESSGGIDAVTQQKPHASRPAMPTIPQPPIPSSAPPPPPSRVGQPPPPPHSRGPAVPPAMPPAMPPQRAAAVPPPLPPNRAPVKSAMAAPPPPPPPSRGQRQPPPSMAPPANQAMPPAMAPPPPPRAPAFSPAPPPPANMPPPPASYPPAPPPGPAMAVPPPPPPPGPGLHEGDDIHSSMLSQIRGGSALKHVDPSEHESATPDSRGQLLNQIRGGFNLKQVEAAALERPPSTAGAEDGLAGALARALANRARHIHEDDEDDDDEEDEDWSD